MIKKPNLFKKNSSYSSELLGTNILNKFSSWMISKKELLNRKSYSDSLSHSLYIGLSFFSVFLCVPLLLYGSYLFFREGSLLMAGLEAISAVLLVIFIFTKRISVCLRELILILSLYSFSIFLLIAAGNTGAGMIGVFAVIALSGIVLKFSKLIAFLVINVLTVIVLTVLLFTGVFDGGAMEAYKDTWLINILTTQLCGIGIMLLIHMIYKALQTQNKALEKSEAMLKVSEERKSLLLSNISGMVYRCRYDQEWTMEYISEGCFALTGYKPQSLLYNKQLSYNDLISEEYREAIWHDWAEVLNNKTIYRGEYQIITAQGEKKWVYEQGKGIYEENGIVNLVEGIIIDITERKNKEDRILYLNQYDVLTGLYNRRWFEEQKSLIKTDNDVPVSVIIGDINGLKLINDALGHHHGDRLIQEVAGILKSCCREGDLLARIGGDEFIMIMPCTGIREAADLAEGIQKKCEKQNQNISEAQYYLSLSLGYATTTANGQTIDEIIKIAENYMYRRKLLENKSVHSALLSSIQATMYERSYETEAHSLRIAVLAKQIGLRLNLSPGQLDELELLAKLHDIGKIGIDDSVLKKPGRLTEAEWMQMRRHPEIGYRISISSPELAPIAEYILCHHEHWDGTGYPQGLKHEEIPVLSRIIAIADAFDAMTNDRPYQKKMLVSDALQEIKSNSGKQFDPKLVDIALDVIENSPTSMEAYTSDE